MLNMFSDDAHPHLISLFATYEQFETYHLLFPCATCNLQHFWSHKDQKPVFGEKIGWVAKQCEGIAGGLLRVHQYRSSRGNRWGRHGDLKPVNILWFDDANGGILKIADFGLSEYSTNHSRSMRPKEQVATSVSYRPPECDVHGGKIGQSYDIWTLGCLYLEFITWLLGGWTLVVEFETKRVSYDPMWYGMHTDTFFELEDCSIGEPRAASVARVKPAVTQVCSILLTQFDLPVTYKGTVHQANARTSFMHGIPT
jgi:serine/threonine protein kinase